MKSFTHLHQFISSSGLKGQPASDSKPPDDREALDASESRGIESTDPDRMRTNLRGRRGPLDQSGRLVDC